MSLNVSQIRTSFSLIAPKATEVVAHFYTTLFTLYPESKELFRDVNMDRQQQTLIGALVKVMDGLDDLSSLKKYLKALGARHVNYGVQDEHYEMVGRCLLLTFKHFFQERWTSDLEDQWILAIGLIADSMIEGAREFVPVIHRPDVNLQLHIEDASSDHKETPNRMQQMHTDAAATTATSPSTATDADLSLLVRKFARNILIKALEEEIDGEFMKIAKKKAALILNQAIREESQQLQAKLHTAKEAKAA